MRYWPDGIPEPCGYPTLSTLGPCELVLKCQRPYNHDGDHAASIPTNFISWSDDPSPSRR